MGLAVEVLLEKRNPITNDTKLLVREVFESIKTVTIEKINKYKVSADLQRHMKKKVCINLNCLHFVINYCYTTSL